MISDTPQYLRENVYFEPLVHKWYAWPHLVPPVTSAMNIAGRNMRLLRSFIENHQLHISASQNPDLIGGEFVSCRAEQLQDVKLLVDEMSREHSEVFAIREAVIELSNLLEKQEGYSLESLYSSIPEILRGYVELTYDMRHNASFRLIEGLLYKGDLYKESAQSVALGLLEAGATRPFVLASPRLPDSQHLHIRVSFCDTLVDKLASMRTVPETDRAIRLLFENKELTGGLQVPRLFTSEPPARDCPPLESGLRLRFLGHAGLLLETARTSILVDPVIACRNSDNADSVISFSEIPNVIDFICITHTHMDHLCLETLLQLRHKARCVLVPKNGGSSIADPSMRLMLMRLGFEVREVEEMELIACKDGLIRAIPFLGEHADLDIRSKTAWYFEFNGKKIFSGADSSSLDEALYKRIHEITGDLDLFLIGMECVGAPMNWLYGSLFTKPVSRAVNDSRRFNGSDFLSAKRLVDIFKPSEVYIYALGMEPWFSYFMGVGYNKDSRQIVESDKLLEYCSSQGIQSERLFSKRTWNL